MICLIKKDILKYRNNLKALFFEIIASLFLFYLIFKSLLDINNHLISNILLFLSTVVLFIFIAMNEYNYLITKEKNKGLLEVYFAAGINIIDVWISKVFTIFIKCYLILLFSIIGSEMILFIYKDINIYEKMNNFSFIILLIIGPVCSFFILLLLAYFYIIYDKPTTIKYIIIFLPFLLGKIKHNILKQIILFFDKGYLYFLLGVGLIFVGFIIPYSKLKKMNKTKII
ncbi:MAG: hypothetical protein FXF47_07525 [Candidatus Mcinerneyibacterium aminivorans]|uniref:Uncharacterized protein n=1 Tax=Candidatus Mcinerneyibacterium aminivorans TaxID=2703815 RepID=A0A5D0MHM8_9BACT|nr:MAG: hypothetical protein FXF47_07525 [Candidatus Mcinerneyibacterium aminivorans]